MRRTRNRQAGLTLTELMAVVVIIAILGSVGMYSVAQSDTQPSVAALARSVQLMLVRARLEAMADNQKREVACSRNQCSYLIWSGPSSTPATTLNAYISNGEAVQAGSGARGIVWNVTATTDQSANNAGGSATTTAGNIVFNANGTLSSATSNIVFNPDGTSSGGTIYLTDAKGKMAFYKVYVYPATGMARMVSRW